MRHTEFKKCRKCGRMYKWTYGGIVAMPKDHADRNMCSICRKLDTLESIIKVNKK